MTNQPPHELFAERPVSSRALRRGPPYAVRRLITIFVLLIIVGGVVYLVMGKSTPKGPAEIPTVKSEGPYKQRPEQPGGIDIPHQDVQVYQELDNSAGPKQQVEHLLPPPETPQPVTPPSSSSQSPQSIPSTDIETLVPPSAPIATTVSPAPTTTVAPSLVTTPSAAPTPFATTVAPAPAAAPLPFVTSAPNTTAKPVAPVPAKSPAPAAAKPASIDQVLQNVEATKETVKTGTVVQLASLPDQTAAETDMEHLQSKYAGILGNTQLRIVQADLGSKGIYYRIQSQPVSDTKASSICAAIKNMNAGCIVVRP